MSEKFYTNCSVIGNTILYRGIENGERIKERVQFKPKLFLPTNKPSKYKTLDGQACDKIEFGDIKEARDFVKQYSDVDGFKFFGNTRWVYVYLSDRFPNVVEFDPTKIVVANIDIEVASENGFAPVENPTEEITAITIKAHGRFYVFGCGIFETDREDVKYIKSRNEPEMLRKFIEFWETLAPDVVTGWNCLPLNSFVYTNNSIKKLKNLYNKEILNIDNNVTNLYPKSTKRIWEINLATGQKISSSGEHKFFTCKPKVPYQNITQMLKAGIWTESKNIDKESFLVIPKHKNINQTTVEDLDLFYVLGMLFTDGTKQGKAAAIYNTKDEIINRVALFTQKHKIANHASKSGISLSHRPCKRVRMWLRDDHILSQYIHLIYNDDKKELNVEELSKLSKEEFEYFLSGLIDGDGSVGKNGKISFCNYNDQISNLNELLLWNGIISSGFTANRLYISKRCEVNLKLSHPIKKSRLLSADMNFFRAKSAPNKIAKILENDDCYLVKVKSVVETSEYTEMMDIETSTHEFIVSGVKTHNCTFYDIPYIVNRISRVFSDKEAKRLSPWGFLSTRSSNYKGKQHQVVEIVGISTLDYIELYRKFGARQESEKLNYVAYAELGEKKISYTEFGSLHELYKHDYQKFIEYNIKDVDLVDKLEQKLQLINMSFAMAFDAKVNFSDVFTQTRMWDAIIFDYVKKKDLVLPQVKETAKDEQYAGGYVKEITPGMYDWVLSFDLNSLYPNLIAQFNISPEMLIQEQVDTETFRKKSTEEGIKYDISPLLDKKLDLSHLKDKNITMAANGYAFLKEKQGFLPDILMRMYEDRKMYKKKMIEAQKDLELVKEEMRRRGI